MEGATDFGRCAVLARIDNGLGIGNPEQGTAVSVCRDPRAPRRELWPTHRHFGACPSG
ncbi:hypothetical protein [Streptomyces pinistramenti]|uniref:hypothetical protein n=1 Tax=Streptomyces pinistramenti TaxID=2884812 RepID=UPI001D07D647|nr:hypothetical protein [Streptomyces pinistramenti]MCB5911380.1 hypothetical protein [Streptomyces pinistramenti]